MEIELTQIYTCPRCRLETPHYIIIRRGERVGIECSQCHTTSLVHGNELVDHQLLWEEELRQILMSLEDPDPEN